MWGSGLVLSCTPGGGLISVSAFRMIFSDLLHLFTASTLRTPMETPTTRVNKIVRIMASISLSSIDRPSFLIILDETLEAENKECSTCVHVNATY